jgi:hypothetical protein
MSETGVGGEATAAVPRTKPAASNKPRTADEERYALNRVFIEEVPLRFLVQIVGGMAG